MSDKLYIVMPAYNEEENIDKVASEWHKIVSKLGGGSRLVIVDDGSKDKTYEKMTELKKDLEFFEPLTKDNSGHGATLLYAYDYALKNGADYIFQTDSDGQTMPDEFWDFWKDREKYSAIIGHRSGRQDGLSRIFVTKVLKLVLWVMFGTKITDANTPFRLIQATTLNKYIKQIPKDFNLSNVMLTVLLVKRGENIDFRPITFRPRQGGVNSINMKRIFKIGRQAVKDFYQIRKGLSKKYE